MTGSVLDMGADGKYKQAKGITLDTVTSSVCSSQKVLNDGAMTIIRIDSSSFIQVISQCGKRNTMERGTMPAGWWSAGAALR